MKKGAVFFDLQGTLGGEGLGDIREFSFYPSAISAIKSINDSGLLAMVITNQSRIAKGCFTLAFFHERVEALKRELQDGGARLDAVYCCPHTTRDACTCRKPLPGMLHQAQRDFDLDLLKCYVVGDTGAWDMVLARSVHAKAVLVRTGLGESSLGEYRHTWSGIEPDFIAQDVLDAVRWIRHDSRKQTEPRCG